MTTVTVNTIGTTGNYSTVQAWEDAAPANLVTADTIWEGQLQNQEFVTSTTGVLLSGSTVDATRYKRLTTVAGASFADNANKTTNALRYNAANGAAMRTTAIYTRVINVSGENFSEVTKVQCKGYDNTNAYETIKNVSKISQVISEGYKKPIHFDIYTFSSTFTNCVAISTHTDAAVTLGANSTATNCTFIQLVAGAGAYIQTFYNAPAAVNCAFFGGATAMKTGTPSVTFTGCYTDLASPPAGCTTVAYNTTTGSGFQNITSGTHDFRLVSTSALINATTTTTAGVDVIGQTRPSGTYWDVGAWEYVAAGGSSATGTAAGTSTASGTGAATSASAGTSAGTAATSGIGGAIAPSTATSAASSTVAGVGAAIFSAVGSSAGTSTTSGVASALASAVGTASADSTVTGVSPGGATSATGSAAAGSTAAGIGVALFSSTGLSAAGSTASGTGAVFAAATGAASAVSSTTALATSLVPATGAATASSTAAASTTALALSTASATAGSTAAGTAVAAATSTGTATAGATAAGTARSTATSTGTAAASAIAQGQSIWANSNAGVNNCRMISSAAAVLIKAADEALQYQVISVPDTGVAYKQLAATAITLLY